METFSRKASSINVINANNLREPERHLFFLIASYWFLSSFLSILFLFPPFQPPSSTQEVSFWSFNLLSGHFLKERKRTNLAVQRSIGKIFHTDSPCKSMGTTFAEEQSHLRKERWSFHIIVECTRLFTSIGICLLLYFWVITRLELPYWVSICKKTDVYALNIDKSTFLTNKAPRVCNQ